MARSWFWIIVFTIVSLAANIASLIGCISPTIKDLALYRVNVTLLADGLQTQALNQNDTRNGTRDFGLDFLPTYWYWGMSGICDVFDNKNENRCRRAFPPTQDLITIVEESMRDYHHHDPAKQLNDTDIKTIIASWNTTLSSISPLKDASHGKSAAESKASAAFAILAIILDILILIVALLFLFRPNISRFSSLDTTGHVPSLFSSLLTITAGTLATLSMRDGVHEYVDTGEHGDGGIIILFVGAAIRFLGTLWRWGSTGAGFASKKEIGYLGELVIYEWVHERIPIWSFDNWTSKLRSFKNKFPPFMGAEWRHADFTYYDHSCWMREALRTVDVSLSPGWSETTTYHIEVKATAGDCDVPFFVSPNQVRLMQKYHQDPNNAYLLARVFHVTQKDKGIVCLPDPWALKAEGRLHFGEPRAKDGYCPVKFHY